MIGIAAGNAALARTGAVGLIGGWLSLHEDVEGRLPFHSPVVAGCALAAVVTLPLTALAASAWRNAGRTALIATATGAALVGWIVVQMAILQTVSWFHPPYLLIGLWIVQLGFRWADVSAPHSRGQG